MTRSAGGLALSQTDIVVRSRHRASVRERIVTNIVVTKGIYGKFSFSLSLKTGPVASTDRVGSAESGHNLTPVSYGFIVPGSDKPMDWRRNGRIDP